LLQFYQNRHPLEKGLISEHDCNLKKGTPGATIKMVIKSMDTVYLDYAATTPVSAEVVQAMNTYFFEIYANPSSLHSLGIRAKEGVKQGREQVAHLLGVDPSEIIFTSSGTESNNLAIKGVACQHESGHIITTSIEHPAVLETCKYLEKQGFGITYLPVDKYGLIKPIDVEQAIKEDTILISVMHANNEIGTIEPIKEIASVAHKHDILVHTDAVQSVGKIPVTIKQLGVDLLSLSAHKIYGPKGVGSLYVKKDVKLQPLFHGGGHERGLRSSTENVSGIVGLGMACEQAGRKLQKDSERMHRLRDRLIAGALEIPKAYLNGHRERRLPNNVHLRFDAIEGESLLLSLDEKRIAASTGSACSSKKLRASHVLMAIGLNEVQAHGSLRLTLGRYTTEKEIEYVLNILPEVVDKLRVMSPLWSS